MDKMVFKLLPRIDEISFSDEDWGITKNSTGWAHTSLNDRFRDLVNAGLMPSTVRQTILDIVKEMEKLDVAKFNHDTFKPFLEGILYKIYGGRV